jgi:hypothetical protein
VLAARLGALYGIAAKVGNYRCCQPALVEQVAKKASELAPQLNFHPNGGSRF